MPNGSSTISFPLLIATAIIIFLANAGLLVLQLVAGRYLAPFVGSSVETWTSVIGIFLTGIALGNWMGGKLADKAPSTRTLALVLLASGIGSLAIMGWYEVCLNTEFYKTIPLLPRIPILAALFCLLPAFTLSLLTPLTIKLILPNIGRTGGIAGMIFALSTLGALAGNYVTGFWLLRDYTLNTITFGVSIALFAMAVPAFLMRYSVQDPGPPTPPTVSRAVDPSPPTHWLDFRKDIRLAYGVVFLASFCGMSLELTASRVLAPKLGVSLFTWTGIIGVMLAGTALGNAVGGVLADRLQRRRPSLAGVVPALALLCAGAALIIVVIVHGMLGNYGFLKSFPLIYRVLGWTFVLFFVPMFMLGTVSPQVIRLSVVDLEHTGRLAGSIYAWSTLGAILGTFAAGYFLIAAIGSNRTLLMIALLLTFLALLVGQLWKRHAVLYSASLIAGGAICGLVVIGDVSSKYDLETKYYAISVTDGSDENRPSEKTLTLDHLIHSHVDVDDPTYLGYEHEIVQGELLRLVVSENEKTHLLVIGGGGYTFPRWAEYMLPEVDNEVVEIDPGVTWIAHTKLGLPWETKIVTHHMDGRQFIAEKAAKKHYQLIVQDAVNDLSVPYHLMTKEYNDAVKAALAPDGVYLLTLIDSLEHGKLWRASVETLRQSFQSVVLLSPSAFPTPKSIEKDDRGVYVIYASDRPFDLKALQMAVTSTEDSPQYSWTHELSGERLDQLLQRYPKMILTDQYAPVDNLMSDVFRRR